jgi:hypothetical protein
MILIERAVLRKQYDCLSVITDLVKSDRGYAGAPLLRAACEELMWIRYMRNVEPELREPLLVALTKLELRDSLKAQDDYIGSGATSELGLTSHLVETQKSGDLWESVVRRIGSALKWPEGTTRRAKRPSAFFIAQAVGMEKDYRFLYHGTSRYVHFSCSELLRRAWGKPGDVSIASAHFADFWGAFGLCWGTRLLVDTLIAVLDDKENDGLSIDEESVLRVSKRIGEFGSVPIITSEELLWPNESTA